ncbi:inositol monophosphatase 1-like [Clavelina lepadiformis]|uniref:inositol monophosphatase 1-like n=1 Tax=Clavelina lepadiformis TaxID=159417 RepID=UPI004043620B
MENLDEILKFGKALAEKAGEEIKAAFLQEKKIETKAGCADLVTETDKKVECMIIDEIKKTYPHHQFIGEESVAGGLKCNLTDAPTWIVDPVDGTTNFVHRYPYVAVCLGFCVNKIPVLGVVYNAISGEMFAAIKGKGAFCNERKIQVSKETDLKKSLIMAEFGSARDPERLDFVLNNLRSIISTPVHSIHCMGSAALNICAVASGQAEAYVEFGIHCWDYCAASVILEEAGGLALDTTCTPLDLMARRILAACNMDIAQGLSSRLTHIELPRD